MAHNSGGGGMPGMPGMMGMSGMGGPGMSPPGMAGMPPPGGGGDAGGMMMPGMGPMAGMMPGMPCGGMGGPAGPGGVPGGPMSGGPMPGGLDGMQGMPCGMPSMPGCGMSGPAAGPCGGMPGMMPMSGMGASGPGGQGGDEQMMPCGGMPGMMPPGMPGMQPNPMMFMMMMMQNAMMQKTMQAKQGQDGGPNPFGAMMGGSPMGMMASSAGNSSSEPPPRPKDIVHEIDPDVRELGDHFNIEERWVKRLNEAMVKRMDTKEQDLAKLYEVLERARSPTGLLTVKIGEMESGQFVGKIKPDKDVERLARKFKLDDHVTSRLTELCIRRKDTKEMDLDRIDQHLRYCKRPSAMATLLAGKLLEGEVDELPDLKEAEVLMTKFRLDEDARSKLREIVEKRAGDKTEVLAMVKKHLETSANASSMLCKIARPLIDGEKLQDPPDRPMRNPGKGGGGHNPVAEESRSGGDRDRRGDRNDKERDRRDKSRDRRHRSRSQKRDR